MTWKKGLALALAAGMSMTALSGCSGKKTEETEKTTAVTGVIATLDGTEVDASLANFVLRYQQAQFESFYGQMLRQYYGDDIWDQDLSGSGATYGETFLNDVMTNLEKMLLAEQHMSDYNVTLTDDEKKAISDAAASFISENEEATLTSMNADQATVERFLTLSAIQAKVEDGMSADVDTNVTDEEAQQKKVSYVRFTVETESAEESTESDTEAEAATEAETAVAAESETAVAAEAETASVESESEGKTKSADSTEVSSEASTEAEAATEAEASTEAESETETEDPAVVAAREKTKAQAEAFLNDLITSGKDFHDAADEITEGVTDSSITTSYFTFGEGDSYPSEEIQNAVAAVTEDGTLIDHPVLSNNAYYVLYEDSVLDREATDSKKEEIVDQRRQDAINALYDEWIGAAEWTVDSDVVSQLLFDRTYQMVYDQETEGLTEAEAGTEAETVAENATEAE